MIESNFANWTPGIFSVMNQIGGPTENLNYHFRRDNPENYNPESGYSDSCITYQWNRHGFRSEEFVNDGRDSILVIGCSFTVCLGVPLEHAWPTLLGNTLSKKVYNLGLAASSGDYAVRALYKTINALKPKAVFILWPPLASRELSHHGRYIPFKLADKNDSMSRFDSSMPVLGDLSYVLYQYQKNCALAENICNAAGVKLCALPLYDMKYYNEIPLNQNLHDRGFVRGFVELRFLGHDRNFRYARDGLHFGKEWNQYVAELYIDQLQLKGGI